MQFARRILLYELTVMKLSSTLELHAGVKGQGLDPNYYVEFRNVCANSEGSGTGGVSSLFGGGDDGAQDKPALPPAPVVATPAPPRPSRE